MPNVLIDTGPLVALFNRRDNCHSTVKLWLQAYQGQLISCWSVLTEVCHLLPERLIIPCLRWVECGGITVMDIPPSALRDMVNLVEKYHDCPMDVADAALVWLANRHGIRDILTLDHNDFAAYRTVGGWPLNDLLLGGE